MPFTLERTSITMLARTLGTVPIELRREMRPKLRASAESIVTDMKARASYSTRIPGAIGISVSFSGRGRGRGGGVTIRVNSKRAPHARLLERGNDGGRSGSFRHPVFGDMETWISQPTRPFFFPAVIAGREQLRKNVSAAVEAALGKVRS